MSVIQLPGLRRSRALPLVAFMNLQKEHLADGRAKYIESAQARLAPIDSLLSKARSLRLPIAHFRRVENGYLFNEGTPFSDWIDGFSPRANEFVFSHSKPSCFSSSAFRKMIDQVDDPVLVVAGFSGEETCLSTVIEGYHLGCRTIFVEDCSATSALGELDEAASHNAVCSIISRYAEISSSGDVWDDVLGQGNIARTPGSSA